MYVENNFCKKCSGFLQLDYIFLLCNNVFFKMCLFATLVWKKFTFVFVGLRRLRMAVLNGTFHSSDAIYFSTPLNLSPIVQNSKEHWKELRVVANGWVHIFKKKHLSFNNIYQQKRKRKLNPLLLWMFLSLHMNQEKASSHRWTGEGVIFTRVATSLFYNGIEGLFEMTWHLLRTLAFGVEF